MHGYLYLISTTSILASTSFDLARTSAIRMENDGQSSKLAKTWSTSSIITTGMQPCNIASSALELQPSPKPQSDVRSNYEPCWRPKVRWLLSCRFPPQNCVFFVCQHRARAQTGRTPMHTRTHPCVPDVDHGMAHGT
jgi:hypothetical protein